MTHARTRTHTHVGQLNKGSLGKGVGTDTTWKAREGKGTVGSRRQSTCRYLGLAQGKFCHRLSGKRHLDFLDFWTALARLVRVYESLNRSPHFHLVHLVHGGRNDCCCLHLINPLTETVLTCTSSFFLCLFDAKHTP